MLFSVDFMEILAPDFPRFDQGCNLSTASGPQPERGVGACGKRSSPAPPSEGQRCPLAPAPLSTVCAVEAWTPSTLCSSQSRRLTCPLLGFPVAGYWFLLCSECPGGLILLVNRFGSPLGEVFHIWQMCSV